MNKYRLLIGLLMFNTSTLVAQTTDSELMTPSIELVTTIFDYCVASSEEQTQTDEQNILQCVNNDLEVSAYLAFSSYENLKAFITPDIEGEG